MSEGDSVRRVIVTGNVQGVGFRAFVGSQGRRRGLRGWVRNRHDGAVEAVFAGPRAAVEEMVAVCRQGPRNSRVIGLRESEASLEDVASPEHLAFAVLPTA